MSDHWFYDGEQHVLVRSGMPEHNVEVGVGDTYREAVGNLESTPPQSVGRDGGVSAALEWAHGADWVSSAVLEEDDDGPGGKETADWETTAAATYVATYNNGDREGAVDCRVEVGQGEDGYWYVRTRDDAGGADDANDTWYATEEAATAAAEKLGEELHEAEPGENAEAYLRRKTEERAGVPDPNGEWCVYWATVGDDERVVDRYATRDQAEASAEIANAALRQAHPGGSLLCGHEVRTLDGNGQWALPDED